MKLLVPAIIVLSLLANSNSGSQVRIGVQGGLNFGTITTSEQIPAYTNWQGRTNIAFSALASIALNPELAIQFEPRYIKKGIRISWSVGLNPTDVTETLSYLEIPILLRYSLPVFQSQPFVFAGPSLDLLLSATEEGTFFGYPHAPIDVKPNYNPNDLSFEFGAGWELPLVADLSVLPSIRYELGLKNIYEVPETSRHTHGIQLTVAVVFLSI